MFRIPPERETMRKLLFFAAIALLLPSTLMAANKSTVKELDDLLANMQKSAKPDTAIAMRLKDIELTEQLTFAEMNSFARYEPGPATVEQIRILAVESALLPPPASDLPTAPAPDLATQKAILARAVDYAAHDFAHLPRLTADKVTARFQNGLDYIRTANGVGSNMANPDLGFGPTNQYLRLLGQHTASVVSESGIELVPNKAKSGDPAGQNGQVSQGGPGPVLGNILIDAAKSNLIWLRWETVNGKQIAVFSFAISKKQSHYQVNYCCFPKTEDVGSHIGASPMGGAGLGPSNSNYGTATSFEAFKTTAGYHGEFFIDPDNGVIVRLITQADLKPTDFVHHEDVRIDYGPVEIDGKSYVVPIRNIILTELVPNGDSFARYSTRRTLFDVTYQNYHPAAM
jgi:hypothetical protein